MRRWRWLRFACSIVTWQGLGTADWYLDLRAAEAGFDALATKDWRQSEQMEELWTLSPTSLSIVMWRRSIEDPVREWGQLLAYLPAEIRRMIGEHGPSIVFLPSQLSKAGLAKASDQLGAFARELSVAHQEVRAQAQAAVVAELERRGEMERFAGMLDR